MITSERVKSLASSLGFDACGIVRIEPAAGATHAPPLPLQDEEQRFKHWIAEGRHGEMKYLEDFPSRAKRFWENFPEAKSIIVVGVNYYSGGKKQVASKRLKEGNGWRGRVARYGWGKDYHQVIGKRLGEFRDQLSELAGREIRAEICVDTKPLLERALAQKAGLGFIGKQSQLLSPKFGPWLFLAELVTDLELEPDLPFVGSCGTCRICIDECPTQAIQPEGGIDARRCIAYLTIEHKTEIPEALRPLLGERVFGCDLCLQVCPYTSKSKETHCEELKAESGFGPSLDLVEILEISSNRLHERKFEGTAILRARRKQLQRNAKIVLENLGVHERQNVGAIPATTRRRVTEDLWRHESPLQKKGTGS